MSPWLTWARQSNINSVHLEFSKLPLAYTLIPPSTVLSVSAIWNSFPCHFPVYKQNLQAELYIILEWPSPSWFPSVSPSPSHRGYFLIMIFFSLGSQLAPILVTAKIGTSQMALVLRTHLPMKERGKTWVWSLGQEDPLEEEMATHSNILAWRIPWTEEPGRLQAIGSQRIRHKWSNLVLMHHCYPPNSSHLEKWET